MFLDLGIRMASCAYVCMYVLQLALNNNYNFSVIANDSVHVALYYKA